MKVMNTLRSAIKQMDYFTTSKLLRYNRQAQYKSVTGGLTSILIIVGIMIQFTSQGLKTLNKQIITATVQVNNDAVPSPITFSSSPAGGFMFAVIMNNIDLNSNIIKYFDIELVQSYYRPVMDLINSTRIQLIQCTKQHFSFNQEIQDLYGSLGGQAWLCPRLNSTLHLQGKLTSDLFSQLKIMVKKCNNTLNTNCANDTQINDFLSKSGNFQIGIPLVNSRINPTSQNQLQYFIQQRNFFPFSLSMGLSGRGYIESYQIITDQSIWPIADEVSQVGINIPQLFYTAYYSIFGDVYASFSLVKSSTTRRYKRQYYKIDEFLSYIGGLINTVLGLFFIFQMYNQMSYQLSLAHRLFMTADNVEIPYFKFNLWVYVVILFQKIVSLLKLSPKCQKLNDFEDYHKQMQKQLDIGFILRRLIFLEEAIFILLDEHQYDVLHIERKLPISKIREIRSKYVLKWQNEEEEPAKTEKSSQQGEGSPSMMNQLMPNRTKLQKIIEQIINNQNMSSQSMDSAIAKSKDTRLMNIDRIIKEGKEGNAISQKICWFLDLHQKQTKIDQIVQIKSIESESQEQPQKINLKEKQQNVQ